MSVTVCAGCVSRIGELESENAGLKERLQLVAMLARADGAFVVEFIAAMRQASPEKGEAL